MIFLGIKYEPLSDPPPPPPSQKLVSGAPELTTLALVHQCVTAVEFLLQGQWSGPKKWGGWRLGVGMNGGGVGRCV